MRRRCPTCNTVVTVNRASKTLRKHRCERSIVDLERDLDAALRNAHDEPHNSRRSRIAAMIAIELAARTVSDMSRFRFTVSRAAWACVQTGDFKWARGIIARWLQTLSGSRYADRCESVRRTISILEHGIEICDGHMNS